VAPNSRNRVVPKREILQLVPMQGVSKYFNTRLPDAILALTGSKFPKKFTSHDLRRTVATRLAESLGDEGDKLVRRVLGHSDGSVTAIYNRYGYVREMRRALEQWANDLTTTHGAAQRQHLRSRGTSV
jgi:integrase